MARITAALAAISFSTLMPNGVDARDISRLAQQFGDISYTEIVSSRSDGEPAFVGAPDDDVTLTLDIPVPVGALLVEDTRRSMTIGLHGKRCQVSISVDGYRDLSIAEIERDLRQLQSDCRWSDAEIANTMVAIESKAENLRNAIEYMRRRAIVLLGSDLRCDPGAPLPKPSMQLPVILDGFPPTPCHDTGTAPIRRHSPE